MVSEGKRIYVANLGWNTIQVYEVVKETPKLFMVKALTYSSYDTRFRKDEKNICQSLEEARARLALLLRDRIDGLKKQLAETNRELDRVPQMEPEYFRGESP